MDKDLINILEIGILSFFIIFILSTSTIIILFLYKKREIDNRNKIQVLNYKFQENVLKSNLEIQEETLHNISREIHDNISLSLTLSKLYLNTLPSQIDEKTSKIITSSIDLISKSLYDLNNLSKSLDGEMIKRNGLLITIENEVENVKIIGTIDIDLIIHGECVFLKPEVELLIFRIIQETLKNSITHSSAKTISLIVKYVENQLYISISDSGKGFLVNNSHIDGKKKMSSGIASMKKRAELINAQFEIESILGKGTKTTLIIPINQNDKR